MLGNPHYHMPHDNLEYENHQLIAEVSKTTAATIMLLASSPSRLTGVQIVSFDGKSAEVKWTPSPEKGIKKYVVAWGPDVVASSMAPGRARVERGALDGCDRAAGEDHGASHRGRRSP